MDEPTDASPQFTAALRAIAGRACHFDRSGKWPTEDLKALSVGGATAWSIPKNFGGDDLPALELHLRYEQLATASVAAALILTQRDAAVGLIDAAVDFPRRTHWLTQLSRGYAWATVGIAQLTTSRQGGTPAVTATASGAGYALNGTIPWATGAAAADVIVTGAALENGQQLLVAISPDDVGVTVLPGLPMVALTCTSTGPIELRNVVVSADSVMRGPTGTALIPRRNGLVLGQTFIATGLCRAALDLIGTHDSDRARAAAAAFSHQLETLRERVRLLCQPGQESAAAAENAPLRGACNDLALRVTHAAVALFKGAALVLDHPAQRLAREAMFLLVWSCPNPVIDKTVELLTG